MRVRCVVENAHFCACLVKHGAETSETHDRWSRDASDRDMTVVFDIVLGSQCDFY